MKYRTLGGTGLQVSELCLGTLMLSAWGKNTFDDSDNIIQRALSLGINYFDTADSYSRGESETFLGRSLKKSKKRDRVIIATKVNSPMGADPNSRGSSRRWITKAVEESLRRLDTDWIDIYQLHRPDPNTELSETISTLQDLVQAGKIRYFGTSTFPITTLMQSQWIAETSKRARPMVEQPPYSILARDIEREILPFCEQYKVGASVWSPLAGGWLAGKINSGSDVATERSRYWGDRYDMSKPVNQTKLRIVQQLSQACAKFDIQLNVAAIAFVLNHPGVASAIIGPRTISHLEATIQSVDTQLPAELLDIIDEIVPPGTTVSDDDRGYLPPAITDSNLRRRNG
ncbi:aldo/keto reductase [Pseudomonas frederiksbergensis]|uniref:Aldo/keto reductase n=1 Tax=Pseudomonas frederiksbergensis TaxID=104087 RepID=A0A423HQU9_9PSED|nr:aldo/keto reductase [Pseudomonas frederiksbergensis]RON15581.1 aldo/keto reductase [Pseudomonas frederiksbergensis]